MHVDLETTALHDRPSDVAERGMIVGRDQELEALTSFSVIC